MEKTNENNTANDNEKVPEAAHGTEQAADVNMGAADVTEKSGKTEVTGKQEESRKMESTGKEPEGRKDTIRQEYGFASDVKLKECKFCCVMIPKKAKICPNCKMGLKSHWFLKSIAAILTVAVIAAGSYYLSAYWGLIDDAAIPVWMARHRVAAPVMSVASMEPAGTGANLAVVEAVETEEENQVSTGEEDREAASASNGEGNRETADAVSGTEDQQVTATALKEEEGQNAGMRAAADEAVDQEDMEAGTDQAKEEESGEAEADTDTERSDSGSDETDAVMKNDTEMTERAKDEPNASKMAESDREENNTDEEERDNEETVPGEKETEFSREIPETADEDEAAFRADCVQVDYKTLLRKQQDYVDTALMIEAQVVCQIDGGLFDDNTYYLCVTEEKSGIKRYYIIRDDRETDDTLILEGDMLTVYGRLFGDCKIPAKLIETRPTVPALSMLYYDLIED